MARETEHETIESCYLPAERVGAEELAAAREAFLRNEMAVTLLEAIPDPAMVVNEQRQIIAVNGRLRQMLGSSTLSSVLGLRPGEAVACLHGSDAPGGCGTGPFCLNCGAAAAIAESLEGHTSVSRECRLLTGNGADGGALDLEVQATFVPLNGSALAVVALRDISAEKRRQVLERVFFHDVLNTAISLHSLAQFIAADEIPPELQDTYRHDLQRVSGQIVEEIVAQRQLLAAEKGALHLNVTPEPVPALLESVLARYRSKQFATHAFDLAEAPEVTVETDATLLRRILGNLVKNALEATPTGGTITVRAREEGEAVRFEVHNPSVIPPAVQQQIFQRSFSTKGGHGRGIGTYSIRLFTERYLGGRVSFESREGEGTRFWVTVPKKRQGIGNRA